MQTAMSRSRKRDIFATFFMILAMMCGCCIGAWYVRDFLGMVRIMKAQALTDNSMMSYMVSKKTMEVNSKHLILTELKKKAAAEKSDKPVKDLICFLFDTSFCFISLPFFPFVSFRFLTLDKQYK